MPSTPIRDAASTAGYLLDDAQLAAAEHLEDLLGRVAVRRRRGGPDDAGDATLLSRALGALLGRGVMLVATSNYPPKGLLPDPLFHELAEPLIDLLESRLDVLRVDGPVDYRELDRSDAAPSAPAARGWRAGSALVPGTPHQQAAVGLVPPAPHEAADVTLSGGRSVRALRASDGAVWFDFAGLCTAPVSALDLLSLADRYGRWVVSDVVPFADCHVNTQQRFVSLVDVLYDRDLSLVLTAPRPLDELFSVPAGRPAPPDLARATSRLRQLRQTAHMSDAHER
ncbi:AFG1-like ATPase [Promicromonospora umidemergens]|uniref:Cell division protein ZapE n=1 Tax=Promicromonospora umidemergens TaxID=629679 RepID=A0ABP8X425_9MICO|nr:cell division protein ZapE [Promicromonospora umidemergens]MCP2285065.1 AFG1-like ATPase [Promicromonospora umidemergens]